MEIMELINAEEEFLLGECYYYGNGIKKLLYGLKNQLNKEIKR